nr:hypothetical protein [Streptomyces sp. So13.3]
MVGPSGGVRVPAAADRKVSSQSGAPGRQVARQSAVSATAYGVARAGRARRAPQRSMSPARAGPRTTLVAAKTVVIMPATAYEPVAAASESSRERETIP